MANTPRHNQQYQRMPRVAGLDGLDGLRAIAVVAVLLYHVQIPGIAGGFLGVDVFFVISGYLITALLLAERRASGTISLRRFWARRARRLLPAAVMMMAATLSYALLFLPDEVARLRGDLIAASVYLLNWHLALDARSYFVQIDRPSPLQHMWSLAIEEQFYLVWPLVCALMLRWSRARWLALLSLIGVVASAMLMATGYDPTRDPSRLYYGTDTRAMAILLGAALACVLAPGQRLPRSAHHGADLVGVSALAGILILLARLDEWHPLLYRGGFLLVALLSVLTIVGLVAGRWLGRALSSAPLRWLGTRSYSLYLWHWPVVVFTQPYVDLPLDGLPLAALQIALALALAECSYRFVETPFRTGAVERCWQDLWISRGRRRLALRWAGSLVGGLLGLTFLGVSAARAAAPAVEIGQSELRITPVGQSVSPARLPIVLPTVASATLPAIILPVDGTAAATPLPTMTPAPVAEPPVPLLETPAPVTTPLVPTPPLAEPGMRDPAALRIYALGDSVLIGAGKDLQQQFPLIEIDAKISRRADQALQLLRDRALGGTGFGEVTLLHIGTNGPMTAEQFDEMLQILKDVPRVVVVNIKAPRRWEATTNQVIAAGVARYPNALLVDWRAASSNNPEFFGRDGIHLKIGGVRLFTQLITEAILRS